MIRNGNKRAENYTASPDKYPQGKFKDKNCRWCCDIFSPVGPSHLYCSDNCKDKASTDKYYINTYGVTLSEVNELLNRQGGVCAICRDVGFKMRDSHKSPLNLDHCHKTGQVRGLLCHNCNRALGLFKDDVSSLRNAIIYLEGATTIRKE